MAGEERATVRRKVGVKIPFRQGWSQKIFLEELQHKKLKKNWGANVNKHKYFKEI